MADDYHASLAKGNDGAPLYRKYGGSDYLGGIGCEIASQLLLPMHSSPEFTVTNIPSWAWSY
jgi:hypothetical protein